MLASGSRESATEKDSSAHQVGQVLHASRKLWLRFSFQTRAGRLPPKSGTEQAAAENPKAGPPSGSSTWCGMKVS